MARKINIINSKPILLTSDDEEEEEGELDDSSECNHIVKVQQQAIDDAVSKTAVFEITFSSDAHFMEYSDILMQTIHDKLLSAFTKMKHNVKIINDAKKQNWRIRYFANNSNCDNKSDALSTNAAASSSREESPDYTGLSDLFTIDTTPAVKLDAMQVPSYKRVIKEVLDGQSTEVKRKKLEEGCLRRPLVNCFNCGSREHVMRDCPEQRSARNIGRAIKLLHSNRQIRYFNDSPQKYAHITPGKISDRLKKAMQLQRYELPRFFYLMRVFSYPRGWLEHAIVENSCITLFNSDGAAVPCSDDDSNVDSIKYKYDVTKFIDFPGYNFDPGNKYYDDYRFHNVPPFDPKQSKNEFIKLFGSNVVKAYKMKKLKALPSTKQNESGIEIIPEVDMEIEEDSDSNDDVKEVIFSHSLAAKSSNSTPTIDAMTGRQSPTLADLEAKHRTLLLELDDKTKNTSDVIYLDDTQEEIVSSDIQKPKQKQRRQEKSIDLDNSNNGGAIITESHIGTPILKFSEFDKLPSGDNFKVGVSDVINFENLPESTGKYEQMKCVLKNVRQKLKDLKE